MNGRRWVDGCPRHYAYGYCPLQTREQRAALSTPTLVCGRESEVAVHAASLWSYDYSFT